MALETEIERPAVLNLGLMLCAGAAAVGTVSTFFTTGLTKTYLAEQGLPPEVVAQAASGSTTVIAFISLFFTLLCLFFIAKGKNVARIIWLVLVVLGLLGLQMSAGLVFKMSMLLGLFSLVLQLANLAGTVTMWLKPSSDWFKAMQDL